MTAESSSSPVTTEADSIRATSSEVESGKRLHASQTLDQFLVVRTPHDPSPLVLELSYAP